MWDSLCYLLLYFFISGASLIIPSWWRYGSWKRFQLFLMVFLFFSLRCSHCCILYPSEGQKVAASFFTLLSQYYVLDYIRFWAYRKIFIFFFSPHISSLLLFITKWAPILYLKILRASRNLSQIDFVQANKLWQLIPGDRHILTYLSLIFSRHNKFKIQIEKFDLYNGIIVFVYRVYHRRK